MSERALTLTDMLDKHFPKQELVASEFLGNKKCEHGFILYKGRCATSIHQHDYNVLPHHAKIYELYDGDHDYPFAKIGEYDLFSVYDISDVDKEKAFLRDYLEVLDSSDMWDLMMHATNSF